MRTLAFYLPMQNSRKIASSTSSLVTWPLIDASASAAIAMSTATISGGIFIKHLKASTRESHQAQPMVGEQGPKNRSPLKWIRCEGASAIHTSVSHAISPR
jgi:hypothetical protein